MAIYPFSFSNTESRAVSGIDFGSRGESPRSGQKPIDGRRPQGQRLGKRFGFTVLIIIPFGSDVKDKTDALRFN